MSVRERPIIMQAESVRAILAGRKTQTRRAYKPRNPEPWELPPGEGYKDDGTSWPMYQDTYGDFHPVRCPYGAPGDRLWVREAWRPWFDESEYAVVQYRADGATRKPEGLDVATGWNFAHECDDATDESPWRSPLFMPRWASRLTLEVVEVRVQRVQDISGEDAVAEGAAGFGGLQVPKVAFAAGWDSLNAKRGFPWASNPWVWAVTFKRVEMAHVST